jgi:ubiquinone/menaquinone biosynthesis C-methylase UbiE
MTEHEYGRLDQWKDSASMDEATVRDNAARLELRAQSEDERAARAAYLELLGIAPGERVLEVGCGSGAVLRDVARRVAPDGVAVGLDPSALFLIVARELAERDGVADQTDFKEGDARSLPFADAEFDVVLAVTALSHVPNGDSAIPEMVRVTRPGGRVGVFDLDTDAFLVSHPDRTLTRRIIAAGSDHGTANGWIGRRLPGLLVEAGLDDVRVRGFASLEREVDGFYATVAERRSERAVQAGAIGAEERQRWLDQLHAEQAAGRFLAGQLHIFAWGIRPLVMLVTTDAEAVAAEPATVEEELTIAVSTERPAPVEIPT